MRVGRAAPGSADDVGSIVHGIEDGWVKRGVHACAGVVQALHRHHLRIPGHANHADTVISHGRDGAGYVCAMTVVIDGVVALLRVRVSRADEIPSAYVVNVTVVIVVNSVVGDFACVYPHVGGDVGMVVIDAGVHDGDDNARAGTRVPGGGRANFLNSPKIGIALAPTSGAREVWVVGSNVCRGDSIFLGELHFGIGFEIAQYFCKFAAESVHFKQIGARNLRRLKSAAQPVGSGCKFLPRAIRNLEIR